MQIGLRVNESKTGFAVLQRSKLETGFEFEDGFDLFDGKVRVAESSVLTGYSGYALLS